MFKPFKSGSKVVSSAPTVTANTSKGSFSISTSAMKIVGIQDIDAESAPENRVILHIDTDAENVNRMFGISRGYSDVNGEVNGAKVSVNNGKGGFAFAPAWPIFIGIDANVDLDDLTRKGILQTSETPKGTYVAANRKVQYVVSEEAINVEVEPGVNIDIFYLTDPMVKEVSRKGATDNDDDDDDIINTNVADNQQEILFEEEV